MEEGKGAREMGDSGWLAGDDLANAVAADVGVFLFIAFNGFVQGCCC